MQAKKVLVVGGAGFIGSEVNKLLHEAGYETVVLDNLSQGKRRRVKWGTFIRGDIGKRRALEKLFKSITSTPSCTLQLSSMWVNR